MGEKMTNAQAAEILRQHNAWRRGNDDEMPDAPVNPTRLGKAIDHAVAHLTQPAQAVDVGLIAECAEALRRRASVRPDLNTIADKLTLALSGEKAGPVGDGVLQHARHMIQGHYPSHREYQVAEALLGITGNLPASPAPGKEGA